MESLSYPSNTDGGILDEVYVKDGINDHPFESFMYLVLSKPIIIDAMDASIEKGIEDHGEYGYLAYQNINQYTGFH